VSKVREGKDDFGLNAYNAKFENLFKSGVIDSTKVVRVALLHAASVAGMMITTEAAIAEKPEKKKAAPGGHGHSHDDDFDDEY